MESWGKYAGTFFVNPAIGSDENDGVAPSAPLKTMQYAISKLPPHNWSATGRTIKQIKVWLKK